MLIDRHIVQMEYHDGATQQAFCPLECKGCRGLCLAVYMMLTRDEQEEMCRRHRAEPHEPVIGHC